MPVAPPATPACAPPAAPALVERLVERFSVAMPRTKSLLRLAIATPDASPKPTRPKVEISRVAAPNILSAGSFTAIIPLSASCSAFEVLLHESVPTALE
eukprot:2779768-Prymnesium_polylepis.1